MADLNTTISDFLRDSQFRVAELSVEMAAMKTKRPEYYRLHDLRAQLILWMDLLYESRDNIHGDDFNYLDPEVWSERAIISECEYLRKISGMATIGYITFAGYSPIIRNIITGVSGGNLPAGLENQYIVYDVNGNPVATNFPTIGGMQTETITQYFS